MARGVLRIISPSIIVTTPRANSTIVPNKVPYWAIIVAKRKFDLIFDNVKWNGIKWNS